MSTILVLNMAAYSYQPFDARGTLAKLFRFPGTLIRKSRLPIFCSTFILFTFNFFPGSHSTPVENLWHGMSSGKMVIDSETWLFIISNDFKLEGFDNRKSFLKNFMPKKKRKPIFRQSKVDVIYFTFNVSY